MVLLNLSSSSESTFKIHSLLLLQLRIAVLDSSITVVDRSARRLALDSQLSSMAGSRRSRRRSDVARPSLEGMMPSEIIKVQDLIWSVQSGGKHPSHDPSGILARQLADTV